MSVSSFVFGGKVSVFRSFGDNFRLFFLLTGVVSREMRLTFADLAGHGVEGEAFVASNEEMLVVVSPGGEDEQLAS
jgi:hypothetical protein